MYKKPGEKVSSWAMVMVQPRCYHRTVATTTTTTVAVAAAAAAVADVAIPSTSCYFLQRFSILVSHPSPRSPLYSVLGNLSGNTLLR